MFEVFKLTVDAGSQPEELNKKAVAIINRVRDKLTGLCTTADVQFQFTNNYLLLFFHVM